MQIQFSTNDAVHIAATYMFLVLQLHACDQQHHTFITPSCCLTSCTDPAPYGFVNIQHPHIIEDLHKDVFQLVNKTYASTFHQ